MAATYTEISLDDMERFLKRGFRALKPKQGMKHNEYYYDLRLSDNVHIRVWTSVKRGSGTGAGVGQDAIRVQLLSSKTDRPLQRGKAPIVKRTQNWRDGLQKRIEDAMEAYDDQEESIEQSAQRSSPSGPARSGPTEKQVRFALFLLKNVTPDVWDQRFRRYGNDIPDRDSLEDMPGRQVSALISDLLNAGFGRRYSTVELAEFME